MSLVDCAPENAARFLKWIETRGGIAVWRSLDLSSPGKSWSTPVQQEDGTSTKPPHWSCDKRPFIVSSAEDVDVIAGKRVATVRIGLQQSGFAINLTPTSSARLRDACRKAGEGAWYEFDENAKGQRVAHIYVPSAKVPLSQWFCPTCGKEPVTAGHDGLCNKCWTDKAIG